MIKYLDKDTVSFFHMDQNKKYGGSYGLGDENVLEAISYVQPWGVDSLTHANQFLPDGGFRKDIDRVHQFVKTSKGI